MTIAEKLEEIKRQCPPRFEHQTVDTQFYLSLIDCLKVAVEALENCAKPVDLDNSILDRPLDNMSDAGAALATIKQKLGVE